VLHRCALPERERTNQSELLTTRRGAIERDRPNGVLMQRNRMTPPPRAYYQAARSRPWPRVSWWYSLLFAIPLLILLVMGISSLFGSDGPSKTIEVAVTDQASGRPLQGAVVSIGDQYVDT